MAFQAITSNSVIGSMSPVGFSLLANSGGTAFINNATDVLPISTIKAPMYVGSAKLVATTSDAYGSGESLQVDLRVQRQDGSVLTLTLATLDEDTVKAAGTVEFDVPVGKLPVGSVVSLSNTYVAGTPNNPSVSLALQLT